MTAPPVPSDAIMHARSARKRDLVLATDIAELTSAQVRAVLYWLASDQDDFIHVAVTAAVAGQQAAAGLPAQPTHQVWRKADGREWARAGEPMAQRPASALAKRKSNDAAMNGTRAIYIVLPVGQHPDDAQVAAS